RPGQTSSFVHFRPRVPVLMQSLAPIWMARSRPPRGQLTVAGGDRDEYSGPPDHRHRHGAARRFAGRRGGTTAREWYCPHAVVAHRRVPSMDKPGTAGAMPVLPVM